VDLSPGFSYFLDRLSKLLLSTGSHLSLTSLICAFGISILFLASRRHRRNRRIRLKTIARALFPRRITTSPSSHADLGFLFFNVFVFSLVLGWAVLSYQFVSNGIISLLVAAFGPAQPTSLPEFISRSVITVALFLAYELGYWLNHYLSHRVPILWEFHRVHHTATVLTPLTNFRVHPVYTWIFANILAGCAAIANGLAGYAFGKTTYQYALSDTNIILVLFIHTYVHLQHSQLWISFPGLWGYLFMSPAHHQVHHSTNPDHYNKNLGSCLAVWDWMFGTLYVPGAPEKLSFGVDPDDADVHTITGGYVTPVRRAVSRVKAVLLGPLPQPAALPARDRNQG
jgi:sterol desaturase/sphingolipid hydroxylase (fatty acid hydroxylase superfamily)